MIEIGKKYRLKKLKGWFEKDNEEFTVLCFGEHNVVGCVAPDGEKYVFDKNFLIDPDIRGYCNHERINYGRKRLQAIWDKDSESKNSRDWFANLSMGEQVCR